MNPIVPLPLAFPALAASSTQAVAYRPTHYQNGAIAKILLVSTDENSSRCLFRDFQRLGRRAEQITNWRSLAPFLEEKPGVDLIILDSENMEACAVSVAKALRTQDPHVPILILGRMSHSEKQTLKKMGQVLYTPARTNQTLIKLASARLIAHRTAILKLHRELGIDANCHQRAA